MKTLFLDLHQRQTRFQVTGKFITLSVLLGLLSTLSTPVNAQPQVTPLVAQAQSTSTTNPVETQLQGRWEVEDPSGQKLTLIFAPEGKFFMLLPLVPDSPVALPFGYRIDSTVQPMHIDVLLPEQNETVMTIFELTDDGQLRLQLSDTNPGQPRPTAFTDGAVLLQKISDETTVPSGVPVLSDIETPAEQEQVIADLETQAREAREAEGKLMTGAMNRAQQAFYLENEKFGTTIEDLSIGIKPESENYRYQIVPQGNQTQSVMMTAQAKRPELRSYTGTVFVVKDGDDLLTVAGICETDTPSSTPPAMPTAPSKTQGRWMIQCLAGSHPLER
ncbi:type IV pilin-like G/H family protein [Microcoleus sp. FACHB-SPT15]|uniref:type IV pilin-like G/H family protein n=1 Tax=Microcoleus sp. FACHB-SPT15 TaxID=2692830 RepID=UPI00177B7CC7|nr:type IV pilin-like G/H family protein [Microcoleus sp. FACHB-SPT15]MBD1807784.1 type IV pilin-like G/H family protein [Microcoleus sp. FACHB-SPT15]